MKTRITLALSLLALVICVAVVAPAAPAHAGKRTRPAAGHPDMPLPDLIAVAATDINNFWILTFNGARRPYAQPRLMPYTEPINTPCGVMGTNNAAYCPAAHAIYYDYNFLKREYSNVGDYAAVGIIAHEWGHVIQAHLGISRGNAFSIQMELQADCFAGAFTQYAERRGELEEGDLDEAGADLFNSGDPRGMPWFGSQSHGKPLQRVNAFLEGYKGGSGACFAR